MLEAASQTPWARAMAACPQHPEHHGEGDCWTHTCMVYQALESDPEFASLTREDQIVLRWAALLHDVAKPACTQSDLSAPGHARKGSIQARQILWREGLPPHLRERVCALVRWHMAPHHLVDQVDWQRRLLAIQVCLPCQHLAMLARADARGRICPDPARLLDQIELFRQLAHENPPAFADDHSRVTYFRRGGDPTRVVYDDTCCQATILCGLPASGKDTWIERHRPPGRVISLDELREQLGIRPQDPQGEVIRQAWEQAREVLRQGQPLVWNATNLSAELRGRVLGLCLDYRARTQIVYCEAPWEEVERRNQARSRPVPAAALERMQTRWEIPDLTEAHQVDYPW